jgi:Ca2+-binding RTX toxin-like protein
VLENRYLIRGTAAQINQFSLITDTYAPSDITDIIITTAGSVDFTGRLGAGVQKLKVIVLAGANEITAGPGDDRIEVGTPTTDPKIFHGADGNDTLLGGFGDDVLEGGAGNDGIDGSNGFDFVSYSQATAGVTVSLAIAGPQNTIGAGIDTIGIAGIEGIIGSNFNDTLTSQSGLFNTGKTLEGRGGDDTLNGGIWHDILLGGADNDTIAGGAGDDTVSGGAGNDMLDGGTGIDTLNYGDATSGVTVSLAVAGPQAVGGGLGSDTLANFENLVGGAFNDTLTGEAGVNRIDGGAGIDTMAAGGGNDIYIVDTQSDVLIEAAGGGTDLVETALANYSLFSIANVERILYTGAGNFVGRGNGLDNRIEGGTGNDRFVVDQGGADRYFGETGVADTVDYRPSAVGAIVNLTTGVHGGAAAGDFFSSIEYFYGSDTAGDNFTGAGFNDRLDGYGGDDVLSGLGGNDTIMGGNGDDEISGGALLDFLYGNAGADDFNYTAVSDSGPTSGARDRIFDFVAGIDDIDVSAIDASAAGGGNNAFTVFLGAGAFTAEGQIRAFQSGANTVIEFNTTGASGAEMQIQLNNFTAANLTFGDFIA